MPVVVAALGLIVVAGCGPVSSAPPTVPPTAAPTVVPGTPTATPPCTPTPGSSTGGRGLPCPKMQINVNKTYTATFVTDKGTIVAKLLPKDAPLAVNNFVYLAKHGFYNNTPFHRIIKGFMIQGGDPTGTGTGGPGYSFTIEPPKGQFTPGTLAMANTGQPNSNGSQFFICQGAQCANLGTAQPPGYTIFGRVTKGMDVVNKIASVPVTTAAGGSEQSSPVHKVLLRKVTISVGA